MSKADESADRAERVVREYSDGNVLTDDDPRIGLEQDVADVVADLHHLCNRYGIPWLRVVGRAASSREGDIEEGGGLATPQPIDRFDASSIEADPKAAQRRGL